MREYGRGSYPGDRREARPGIKRIGSLTPGGERFGHLLQLFLRRPALRDRQLAEPAAEPKQMIVRDSARRLKRAGGRPGFSVHVPRRLCSREACLSEERTQLKHIRRASRVVGPGEAPEPVPRVQ